MESIRVNGREAIVDSAIAISFANGVIDIFLSFLESGQFREFRLVYLFDGNSVCSCNIFVVCRLG